MKLIRTVRNHWKKSIFFSLVAAGGGLYGYNRYKENLLLKEYCLKVQNHSAEKVSTDHKIKDVVVFLNPSSGGGKASKTFKKFAVPMLSCSGINFVIVPTSYEGHVSSLLKYLPVNVEAVVVAGGDGMLQDTVTAVLRNNKHSQLPVGFIPLGTHNTFCSRYLHQADSLTNVDAICQSIINIVEGNVQKVPIMEISPAKGNTIFALSYFTWGSIKGAIDFIPKLWWLGRLQTAGAMLRFSTSTSWPCNIKAKVDSRVEELANLTIMPGEKSGLVSHSHPAVRERMEFFELIGRNIIDNRQSGLLTKLTLGEVPRETDSQEISVVPLSEGKFFVDGESVDCRTIKIKYLTDSISMFVPRNTIPVESVNILPEIPRSISKFMQTLHDFFGIG
ncbi:acylglycerol kinase, mitochondrial-like [Bolinopsis microptera]|uniref:acylglycerol kinase, mitochondrial-like n=1 Tax=Bolinopsis microptera TaxID=2820187 RepID=UPI003078AE08